MRLSLRTIDLRSFYDLPIKTQWTLAFLLALFSLSLVMSVFFVLFPFPYSLLFYPLLSSIVEFCLTPLLRLLDIYRYYSPMLLTYVKDETHFELHSGTSFDYFLNFRLNEHGLVATRKILQWYGEGLLAIIADIESGKLAREIEITGTSYFFSDRTAERLGFELRRPNVLDSFNLLLYFFDLVWMYSYSLGKFALPPVWRMKKLYITGEALVTQKKKIEALVRMVSSKAPEIPVRRRRWLRQLASYRRNRSQSPE